MFLCIQHLRIKIVELLNILFAFMSL